MTNIKVLCAKILSFVAHCGIELPCMALYVLVVLDSILYNNAEPSERLLSNSLESMKYYSKHQHNLTLKLYFFQVLFYCTIEKRILISSLFEDLAKINLDERLQEGR